MPVEIIVTQGEKEQINEWRKLGKKGALTEEAFHQRVWDLFSRRPNEVVAKIGLPNKDTVFLGGWHCYVWPYERIANAPKLPNDILQKYFLVPDLEAMPRIRIAYKSETTDYEGHGEWQLESERKNLMIWVEDMNRQHPGIRHWIEEEQTDNKEPLFRPSPDGFEAGQ